ncbi:putative ribonuclease H-like domain-containing protein, partial [Tanacetum coccineum]
KSNTNKVKSGFTGAYSTCTPSTSSTNIQEREVPASFVDEIAMIAIQMKKFYKKARRRVRVDGKVPVVFDKKKLECFNCHNTNHFARECTSKGINDEKKKRDSVYQNQEAAKQEKNQLGLLTIDDGVVNWGEHTKAEETNHALMEISSSSKVNKKPKYLPIVKLFTKTNDFKGVPHPLNGDYTSKAQEEINDSFAGSIRNPSEHYVDFESETISVPKEVFESKSVKTNEKDVSAPKEVGSSYVTYIKTPRQPIKSQETPPVNRKNWNEMMERELREGYSFTKKKCFVCGSLRYLIKDCNYYEKKMAREAELKKQRVFSTGNRVVKPIWNNANRINHANHFVPRSVLLNFGRSTINSVRLNINTGRTNVNSVRKNVNSIRSKVNTGSFNVNTVRPKHPVSTSTSPSFCLKRPQDHPLKNMIDRGIFNSGCSGHMTGNKDHLDDFEEFNGGSVTFRGSKGYITGISEVTNSAGTPQTPNENASEEKDEAEELIVVSTTVQNTTKKFDTRKSSTNSKEEEFLPDLQERHLGPVPANNTTSTPSVNTSSEPVNPGKLNQILNADPDDSNMPELEIFHRPEKGIFNKASYDEDGVEEPKTISDALKDDSWIEAIQKELLQFKLQQVWILVDLPHGMKVVKALYGLHQAPRAWYATLSTFLEKHGYRRGLDEKQYVAEMLKKFDLASVKPAITPMETKMALIKDKEAVNVNVTPKTLHLNAVKRIFKYLKGKPNLGLWYPRDSPFDLEAYSDSDYAGSNLDRKSITCGCQFLGRRYALTHNPTIYDSLVKQFWQTATATTLADGTLELRATIDNLEYTITEASIRSKLQLADASGISMLPNTEIFKGPEDQSVPTHSHEAGNMTVDDLFQLVPQLMTRIDSLEKELKDTKQTFGFAILTLVQRVKSLEVALKRKTKKVIVSDFEDEETEPKSVDKGRRYKRRKQSKAKRVNTGLDFEDTGFEDINTGFNKDQNINTGNVEINTGSVEKKRKAQVQFEAQHYTKEDWDLIRAKIEANEELSKSVLGSDVQEEDFAKKMVDLVNQRKKFFAKERAKARRNKPMTQTQLRVYMTNFLKNQGTWKISQLKKLTFEEVKVEFDKLVKQVKSFVPVNFEATKASLKRFSEELQTRTAKRLKVGDKDDQPIKEKVDEAKVEESTKKSGKRRKQIARKGLHTEKIDEDEYEKDDAGKKVESTSGTTVPINPVPVAIKPPSIATYKIIKQGKKGVHQIVRENGTDKVYISFGAMLNDISRDDLTELYRIVMHRYGMHGPKDELEKVLWGYLKNMFDAPLNKKLQGGKENEDYYQFLKRMEKQAGVKKD